MLFQKLYTILAQFESQTTEKIFGYRRSFDQISIRVSLHKTLLSELLEYEKEYTFTDLDEEIRYFKCENPRFLKYGFYYSTLHDIELWFPMGSKECKREYYQSAFDEVNRFFIQNKEMILYMRMNMSDNDSTIFVKDSSNNHIFAMIEATNMLEHFLNSLDDAQTAEEKLKNFPQMTWTGTLASLVLLIKALVLSKSINNGNVTIVDLVNYFQVMFNVDLKDHYRKYQDIKTSQDPTKFLDYLIELIEKDIEESDEKLIKLRKRK